MLSKKQLRQRQGKIGASEIGTALGYFANKKESTPFQYALGKCAHLLPEDFVAKHLIERDDDAAPLLRGQYMENSVMRLFKKRNPKWTIRRVGDTLAHPDFPHLVSTVDGLIIDEEGKLWIAEYKTINVYRLKTLAETLIDVDDNINVIINTVKTNLPISIQLQGLLGAKIVRDILRQDEIGSKKLNSLLKGSRPTVAGVVFFYVVIGNGEVAFNDPIQIISTWKENEGLIEAAVEEANTFYHEYMENPTVEKVLSLRNAVDLAAEVPVAESFATADDIDVNGQLFPIQRVVAEIRSNKAIVKEYDAKVEVLESALKIAIGENERIETSEGNLVATWKRQNGAWTIKTETAKKILEEHPEYSNEIRQSNFRRLNIK